MSDYFTLKPATIEHAEGVGRVISDAIERVNAKDYPRAEINRLLQNFTTETIAALLQQRQTLVALAGEQIVGTGAIQGAEVKSVFVAPDWHRRGIGVALVCELEKIAARDGIETLEVSSSLSATQFYSALGFIEKSRIFFGDEETVHMTKAIARTQSR
ncbi:GNAT family N-acetyltransferase [uncultured Roseobacter sp.]|uniref:GNAT family N-acetyltransferase n=1 Tax=uncultured Roseobacter sp. TaxID=114847 RepID=UPI002639A0DA|nr:GNAT family N-acetyltransferase [uncultured Roseobacter sp.]